MEEKTIKFDLAQKRVFNMAELSAYTGISKAYLYVLVRKGVIPYSRPGGKILFFSKDKIDQWLLTNEHEPKPQKR
jgi:prophage regulatory protein